MGIRQSDMLRQSVKILVCYHIHYIFLSTTLSSYTFFSRRYTRDDAVRFTTLSACTSFSVLLLISMICLYAISTQYCFCFRYVVGLYSFQVTLLCRQRRVHRLRLTSRRLGAAAAFLHYLFNPHVPPPLRQTARCRLCFCFRCQTILFSEFPTRANLSNPH